MHTIMAHVKNQSKLYKFFTEKFSVECGGFFTLIDYVEGT